MPKGGIAMTGTNYTRCKVKGFGEVFADFGKKGVHFSIVEMSAEGARIFSTNEFEPDTNVRMKIHLPALLFQVNIRVVGRIDSKIKVDNGFEYETTFVGLPEKDMQEIDILMKSACSQF